MLAVGTLLQVLRGNSVLAISLIVAGVILKATFVFLKISSKKYRPGTEFVFLGLGLTFFFSGQYLDKTIDNILPHILIFVGIVLKLAFIGLFIKKNMNEI